MTSEQETPKKRKGASNSIGLGLIAVLVVGLGGLGITNFSASLRTIGTVGNTEISADQYFSALNQQMTTLRQQFGATLTFQQAQSLGLTASVLPQVVATAAFDNEVKQLGLSVGDAVVADEIRQIDAFKGVSGDFDRDTYTNLLLQNGLSEAEFEDDLRLGQARTLMLNAITGTALMPASYAETLVKHLAETRNFSWAVLPDTLLLGIEFPDPSEDDLTAWYDANQDLFITPETRKISYAWITPDMILDTVEIDESSLRAAYEEQKDQFNMPERRLVERLPFVSEDDANAALERINNGDISFDDLVSERGLNLSDLDLGDVTVEDLGSAADLVFSAEVGTPVGPAESDFGVAIFRVNGILAAQNTSFEDAQPALLDTLVLDRARRVIAAQAEDLDDILAGGATLEELADESEMEFGQIDFNDLTEGTIAGYPAFREAAQSMSDEDFPKIEELGDGGVFALRLDEIVPPAPKPLDEVRDAIVAGWAADQRITALEAQGATLQAALAEGQSFTTLALEERAEVGIDRQGASDLPTALRDLAFDLVPGEAGVVAASGDVYVLRMTDVVPADLEDDRNGLLLQFIGQQTETSLQDDIMTLLSAEIQERAGVNIDQNAVAAIDAGMQ